MRLKRGEKEMEELWTDVHEVGNDIYKIRNDKTIHEVRDDIHEVPTNVYGIRNHIRESRDLLRQNVPRSSVRYEPLPRPSVSVEGYTMSPP